jgi:hypothetical protein
MLPISGKNHDPGCGTGGGVFVGADIAGTAARDTALVGREASAAGVDGRTGGAQGEIGWGADENPELGGYVGEITSGGGEGTTSCIANKVMATGGNSSETIWRCWCSISGQNGIFE